MPFQRTFASNTSDRMVHLDTIRGDIDSYGKFTTACICDSKHTETCRRQRHSDGRQISTATNMNWNKILTMMIIRWFCHTIQD